MANNKIIDLERLSRFKNKLDIELDKKANVDGNYPTMTVGSADNLTPYGENSGANDTTPFVFQTSGGSSDVGVKAYLKALRGNSVAFNQLVQNGNFESTTGWTIRAGSTGTSVASNNILKLTFGGTHTPSNAFQIYRNIRIETSHKYLIKAKYRLSAIYDNNVTLSIFTSPTQRVQNQVETQTNVWKDIGGVITAGTGGNNIEIGIYYVTSSLQDGDTFEVRDFVIYDLTLMFGAGNEPTSVLEFNRLFPKPYYEYNAGTLLSCKVNGIKNVGYNALSLDRTEGTLTGGSNTTKRTFEDTKYYVGLGATNYFDSSRASLDSISSNSITVSGNGGYGVALPIRIVPGQTYTLEYQNSGSGTNETHLSWYQQDGTWISNINVTTNRTQIAPNNAYWGVIILRPNGQQTYSNITFHLTWDGSRTGYEEHKVWQYALPNVELRSTLSQYDVLKHNGIKITKVIQYTITGDETFETFYTPGGSYGSHYGIGMKLPLEYRGKTDNRTGRGAICSRDFIFKYSNDSGNAYMYGDNAGINFINDSWTTEQTFKEKLVGLTINIGLKESEYIEEQTSDTYQEIQEIDDFGTQEFLYDSDIAIPIPQGNDFFYPVDYKAFIDSLGGREDIEYAADQVVSQAQLQNALSTFLSSIQGYDATKTQTLKNVNGVFQWVDD